MKTVHVNAEYGAYFATAYDGSGRQRGGAVHDDAQIALERAARMAGREESPYDRNRLRPVVEVRYRG